MNKSIYILLLTAITLMGCNGCSEQKEITDNDIINMQDDLIKGNKKQHEKEMKEIGKFIAQKKWPMQETKTGLKYWIYEPQNGKAVVDNNLVSVSYTITLLDDTKCYETTDANPKKILVGHDNVESGLHEALMLMHEGERARFILPSHLAFGFTGDSGKIPQNASVVYDMHLISIQ